MIRRIFSSCATLVVLLMAEASAFAMTFMEPTEVMNASFDPENRCVRGKERVEVTDLDGTELVFVVHDKHSLESNYVTLESADGKAVYYTFPAGRWFNIKEIRTENPERNYWLTESWTSFSNEFSRSFCLIGRYGDTYVPYVTLDDLQATGLVGDDVRLRIRDSEIIVQGWQRIWDDELIKKGEKYVQADEVTLFWDEKAQWMGIRRETGTPFVDVEDTWFYTDQDGANYYFRRACIARSWIGGNIFKINTDGETNYLLYKVEEYSCKCPYSIHQGGNFAHLGPIIEHGCLYDGSDANPSVVALYEGYLHEKSAEAAASRQAAEERRRAARVARLPQYCGTDREYDYYMVDVHRPRNPGVYYVTVRRSDEKEYWYIFSYEPYKKTYSYAYYPAGTHRNALGSGLITENQLANDIFYIVLQWTRRGEE